MKKVRVIFYKTPWKFKIKFLINHLISIRTLSKYSHVEIWTPDDEGVFTSLDTNGNMLIHGTAWTSTMRGDDQGTVKRDASGVFDHPENWDYVEIEIEDYRYNILKFNMEWQVIHNLGYAKWDILKFISPYHFPDNNRFICSEFCNDMLFICLVLKKQGIVSPQQLLKRLRAIGGVVKSLIGDLK